MTRGPIMLKEPSLQFGGMMHVDMKKHAHAAENQMVECDH